MRKLWIVVLAILFVGVAVPVAAVETGHGAWLKEQLMALHQQHRALFMKLHGG